MCCCKDDWRHHDKDILEAVIQHGPLRKRLLYSLRVSNIASDEAIEPHIGASGLQKTLLFQFLGDNDAYESCSQAVRHLSTFEEIDGAQLLLFMLSQLVMYAPLHILVAYLYFTYTSHLSTGI